jgi:hypothetical protein
LALSDYSWTPNIAAVARAYRQAARLLGLLLTANN